MTKFNGLIQHSFALRLVDGHQPFDGRSTHETLAERFSAFSGDGRRFRVVPLNQVGGQGENHPAAMHTLLGRSGLTTVRTIPVTEFDGLPAALSWAGPGEGVADVEGRGSERSARPRMVFAEFEEEYGRTSRNDFVVRTDGVDEPCEQVARALLEAVAFRRSQLFGLAIANRFVNVMLPCATLTPGDGSDNAGKKLLLLALVSMMRDGSDRRVFRRMYSLTLYALPVEPGAELSARTMGRREIQSLVNGGWGLSEAIPQELVPRYEFSGSLRDYVESLARPGAKVLLDLARAEADGELSFRMVTEMIAYAVALGMAQGSRGRARGATRRRIGDDVITTLGTARVSAALLVDPKLEPRHIETPIDWRDPPGSLRGLMRTLASDTRMPNPWTRKTRREYQLDRPFVDSSNHAVAILPASRCLLMTYLRKEERVDPVPLLSLVAGATFMTVGAATAIGMLRSIDRDLERLEHEDPRKIAEIDGEVATDLHEIYDLDISNETYRNLYRRLRRRLGITRDFKTLQDKMQTLYSATSTFHDAREQRQIAWLTAAIVVLSVLILIGTIVVAFK